MFEWVLRRQKKIAMVCIPLHIIEIILLRLPVKSLLQFRCVCKEWHTLISHPQFAKAHLQLPQTQRRIRFCIVNYKAYGYDHSVVVRTSIKDCEASDDDNSGLVGFDYSLSFQDFKHNVVAMNSCNGLLCLVDAFGNIVLWNPSTRQCNLLPPIPNNALKNDIWYGLGYDSFADDYKIIGVSHLDCSYETVVDVFSLKSYTWRRVKEIHDSKVAFTWGTFLHGALHWVAWRDDDPNEGCHRKIVAFDLEKEQFREMGMPSDGLYVRLRVVGGCLCAYDGEDPSKVWVMKEYGVEASWTKMATPFGTGNELLHSLNNQHLLLVNEEKLVLWDHKENTYKNIMGYGKCFEYDANLYVESLVSPYPSLESRKGKRKEPE